MGNTVGSLSNLHQSSFGAYILGLWGADRYLRTSSIGLSNTNIALLKKSLEYLLTRFDKNRIRVRVYGSNEVYDDFAEFKTSFCKGSKNKKPAYHIYVNSRPFVREFMGALDNRHLLDKNYLYPYFSGRFDGDGSISKNKKFCRIVYGSLSELNKDRELLEDDIETSTYEYKKAGTYCLYFSEKTLPKFLKEISKYSISGKLQ